VTIYLALTGAVCELRSETDEKVSDLHRTDPPQLCISPFTISPCLLDTDYARL